MRTLMAAGLLGVVVIPSFTVASPTAAQRRELTAIRQEVLLTAPLFRQRKYDEARTKLKAAEERLDKLLREAKFPPSDRSVAGLKRLLEIYKGSLPGAKKTVKRPRSRRRPAGRPGRTIRVAGGKTYSDALLKKLKLATAEELKQFNRDLIYWKGILAGTPSPADKQKALFHVALLSVKTEQYQAAITAYESLVKEDPKGPWARQAKMRLALLKFEHSHDLKTAVDMVNAEIPWANEAFRPISENPRKHKRPPAQSSADRKSPGDSKTKTKKEKPSPAKVPSFVFTPPTDWHNMEEVYRALGILGFVRGGMGATKHYLTRYKALRGRPADQLPPEEVMVERLYRAGVTRRGLTPLTIWQSRKENFPYICYGDALYESGDYDHARDYATALLLQKKHEFTDFQKGYIYYLRGRCLNGVRDPKQRQKAVADFLAAQRLAPKSRWADDCLFLAANASWNHERKADNAIRYWRQLLKDYPDSIEADRTAFYVGVVYEQTKRYRDAKSAYESLLKDRPESAFAELTKEHLKKVNGELARPGAR